MNQLDQFYNENIYTVFDSHESWEMKQAETLSAHMFVSTTIVMKVFFLKKNWVPTVKFSP